MLGLVRPCVHHLDDDLLTQWRAHMCGLCLTLRDTSGQAARATTNTDAILLSILVEAQQQTPAATRTAGPCPLRGMARADVIAPAELSVRLGATASLTLAAAKVGDVAAEQHAGLGPQPTGRGAAAANAALGRLAGTAAGPLARRASRDPVTSAAADVAGALAELSTQADAERRSASLADVTAPTAAAAERMFAASAELAGVPENIAPLRTLGRAYGEFAHLADALADLDIDRRRGAYNPLDATGTSAADAVARLRTLRTTITRELGRARLRDDRLLRALLLGALTKTIRAHSPRRSPSPGDPAKPGTIHVHSPQHTPDPLRKVPPRPGTRPQDPRPYPQDPGVSPQDPGHDPSDPDTSPQHPGPPPLPKPGTPGGGRHPILDRSFAYRTWAWAGVYCTGFACCADHVNACSGNYHPASCTGCDGCGCDGGCCDCCDCCGDDCCCGDCDCDCDCNC